MKRMSEALSVGYVMANADVEDDSPVEYPEVPFYTEWHPYNGKLILVKGRRELGEMVVNEKTTYDTLSFVYMKGDSLALRNSAGVVTGYKRSKDARTVNAKADAAAAKLSEKLKRELR